MKKIFLLFIFTIILSTIPYVTGNDRDIHKNLFIYNNKDYQMFVTYFLSFPELEYSKNNSRIQPHLKNETHVLKYPQNSDLNNLLIALEKTDLFVPSRQIKEIDFDLLLYGHKEGKELSAYAKNGKLILDEHRKNIKWTFEYITVPYKTNLPFGILETIETGIVNEAFNGSSLYSTLHNGERGWSYSKIINETDRRKNLLTFIDFPLPFIRNTQRLNQLYEFYDMRLDNEKFQGFKLLIIKPKIYCGDLITQIRMKFDKENKLLGIEYCGKNSNKIVFIINSVRLLRCCTRVCACPGTLK
jgi:hypothetical protein